MRPAPAHNADRSESEIHWTAGAVPVSARFADPYYSTVDGLAESRHVFLAGTGLPARFRPGFRIAELGFGTGLNMLAALLAWRAAGVPGKLCYTGFEADPPPVAAVSRALAAFPEAHAVAGPLLDALARGAGRIETPELSAEIVGCDARAQVPAWAGAADAWFLDGFAPARNPAMWEAALLAAVAARTAAGGQLATYTAAGHVRRRLAAAGLAVARRPGFTGKRHMTVAWRPA